MCRSQAIRRKSKRFWDLRSAAQYLQILPLWQEAAYSTHEMTEQQRTQMRVFLQTAVSLVWKKLSKKQRLWTTYWLAL